MKKSALLFVLIFINVLAFSQAKEDGDTGYQKVYSILLSKDGEVKHTVKEGAEISAEINDKKAYGRWVFKSYPDVVTIISNKGEILGDIELRKQDPLRISVPAKQGGMSVGIGIGPVGVSSAGGGMQSFSMEKWNVDISERMETKEEKMRREYAEQKEQERLAKQAAKEAKKAAKNK